MNQDNETKQDAWEDPDDLMLEDEPIKTLVLRRYEIGSNPYADKNPNLWTDTRMIINEVAEGRFDFDFFLKMISNAFHYMMSFYDMEREIIEEEGEEDGDIEVYREKEDVHIAVVLREFADLQGDGSDEFKAARLIAEAICMQLCTRLIPPEEGDPRETLVVLDRKSKRFELTIRGCHVDASPLFSEECAL